jgi:hypothetical protein
MSTSEYDDVPDDMDEPQEDDIVTSDDEHWYQYGKLVVIGDRSDVKKFMNREKFWPNVWVISDHGNTCNISEDVSQN